MKATIVSLVPREIICEMPGMVPSHYRIGASKDKIPEVLIVNDGSYDVYQLEGKSIRVYEPADKVAASFCSMYNNSQLGYNENSQPALFFVEGEYTANKIIDHFTDEIERALDQQKNWFLALVFIADDSWSRYHAHKDISDLQRDAARYLNLSREWIKSIEINEDLASCPACGSTLANDLVMKCPMCQTIIKPEEYQKHFGKSEMSVDLMNV